MKYLGPNAYQQIIDPETGAITWQLDPTSKAIEYTDKELEIWIEKNAVPSDLGQFGLAEFKKLKDDVEEKKKFLENHPNPTSEEWIEWFKTRKMATKEEMEKANAFLQFLLDNHEKLQLALESSSNPQTFAIPSHSLMFSLLAMFAGKPERIPRKLLEKPHSERSPEESAEADQYLSSVFEKDKSIDFSEGTQKVIERYIAIISNNPKIEAKADITETFFKDCINFREASLAIYLKRTFGAEGLRHFLGLIIGLEDNFRQGHFEWDLNEHLERLGYQKKSNRSYDLDVKKMASEAVKIFTSFCITSKRKDGKDGFTFMKLFNLEEGCIELLDQPIIDKAYITATDSWYKNAFVKKDRQAPQYTKLLRKIVQENHREHPLTLYLAPLLAIFWRINPDFKTKVKGLMEWCDLNHDSKYRLRELRDLESSLDYMVNKGYLGYWSGDGENKYPSKCQDPLNCLLTLHPPDWLQKELQLIKDKKESYAIPHKNEPILTLDEFREIFTESGLTLNQFANHIGVTHPLIYNILNGKRNITKKTSEKVREFKENSTCNKCDPS